MYLARFTLLTLVALSLAGCATNYRYESRGKVVDGDGESRGALLYYHENDSRLWYGKKYQARESGVDLKVCKATDKSFEPVSDTTDLSVALKSRGGDLRVGTLSTEGTIDPVDPPERLHPNAICARILIDGQPADMEALDEGTTPEVVILCNNPRRPSRYPQPEIYRFDPFSRAKVEGEREPTGPCPESSATDAID
jgi:hypothetical protein